MRKAAKVTAACTCGQVALELAGAPILSAVCYCEDCRTAARQFEQMPGAPGVVGEDGGVDYCLFRKDRVTIERGGSHLREHHLTETSTTRRVVAACCGAPMFLDFTKGHWLTVYRDRLPTGAPPIEMGVMAKDRPAGPARAHGLATYPAYPLKFMFRVTMAWARMGFRRPATTW
jgi:hypothetical protein